MTDTADISRSALRTHSVLGCLPDAPLEALASHGWLMAFAKDTTVYRSGDPSDRLLIVVTGQIRLTTRLGPARDIVVRLLGPGDIDGDIGVLDGGPRMENAVAIEASEAIMLYRQDILQVLGRHPEALAGVMAALATKVRQLTADAEMAAWRVTGGVAHALLRLADQHGRPLPDGILIDLALSRNDLVKYTGLDPEAARHQLGRLRALGLVRPHGARIVILDRDALQDYAEAAGV